MLIWRGEDLIGLKDIVIYTSMTLGKNPTIIDTNLLTDIVIYILGQAQKSSSLQVKKQYGRTLLLGNQMNGLIFQVLLNGGQIAIMILMLLAFVFLIGKLGIRRHLIWFLLLTR